MQIKKNIKKILKGVDISECILRDTDFESLFFREGLHEVYYDLLLENNKITISDFINKICSYTFGEKSNDNLIVIIDLIFSLSRKMKKEIFENKYSNEKQKSVNKLAMLVKNYVFKFSKELHCNVLFIFEIYLVFFEPLIFQFKNIKIYPKYFKYYNEDFIKQVESEISYFLEYVPK